MRFLIIALLLLLSVFLASAQELSFEDLHFRTEIEANTFAEESLQQLNSLEARIQLLMAVDSTLTPQNIDEATKKVQRIVTDLQAVNLRKKKPVKAAKLLYEAVHQKILRKYDEDAQFGELFTTGLYNCVTATALYALVLEEFGLPYQVRELPTHVYLIYAPGAENLILESTDPVEGVFELDKEAIVQSLVEQKMISANERRIKSTEQLYDDYVEDYEIVINIRGLASDLYYNAAIFAMQNEHYQLGMELAKKSVYLFRNDDKVELWANGLLLQLESMNLDKIETFEPLFALQYFPDYQKNTWDDIGSNFNLATENYLITANRRDYYHTVRNYFLQHLSPEATELRENMDFVHFGQLGRHYALLDNLEKAYVYFDSAYQINPSHLNVQAALRDLVFRKIQDHIQADETEDLAEYIKEQDQLHPFLREHERFHTMLIYSEFAPIIEAFEANQEEEALAAFEARKDKLVSLNDGSEPFNDIVGSVYSSASSYYFRITDGKSAKQWLEEGLKIVPDNEELLRKKEMLEDFYDE